MPFEGRLAPSPGLGPERVETFHFLVVSRPRPNPLGRFSSWRPGVAPPPLPEPHGPTASPDGGQSPEWASLPLKSALPAGLKPTYSEAARVSAGSPKTAAMARERARCAATIFEIPPGRALAGLRGPSTYGRMCCSAEEAERPGLVVRLTVPNPAGYPEVFGQLHGFQLRARPTPTTVGGGVAWESSARERHACDRGPS